MVENVRTHTHASSIIHHTVEPPRTIASFLDFDDKSKSCSCSPTLLSEYTAITINEMRWVTLSILLASAVAFGPVLPLRRSTFTSLTSLSAFPRPPRNLLDISGSLISQLAEIALKLRLADQTSVQCEVSSTSTDLLLGGKIGPVTVKGRGWASARGLTCRAIEATVQSCELDIGRIISSQKLVLTTPAEGKAMIALNSQDFGNFITHKLMRPPKVTSGERPVFLKEDTIIDTAKGNVVFYSIFRGHKWQCTLQRLPQEKRGTANVSVKLYNQPDGDNDVDDSVAQELSMSLTNFFNEMVYELDGTFLSYKDMLVTDKGSSPSVMLALNILVRKFPSPGIDF